jgi:hypothetical protein
VSDVISLLGLIARVDRDGNLSEALIKCDAAATCFLEGTARFLAVTHQSTPNLRTCNAWSNESKTAVSDDGDETAAGDSAAPELGATIPISNNSNAAPRALLPASFFASIVFAQIGVAYSLEKKSCELITVQPRIVPSHVRQAGRSEARQHSPAPVTEEIHAWDEIIYGIKRPPKTLFRCVRSFA